jgi:hypothetical protein
MQLEQARLYKEDERRAAEQAQEQQARHPISGDSFPDITDV